MKSRRLDNLVSGVGTGPQASTSLRGEQAYLEGNCPFGSSGSARPSCLRVASRARRWTIVFAWILLLGSCGDSRVTGLHPSLRSIVRELSDESSTLAATTTERLPPFQGRVVVVVSAGDMKAHTLAAHAARLIELVPRPRAFATEWLPLSWMNFIQTPEAAAATIAAAWPGHVGMASVASLAAGCDLLAIGRHRLGLEPPSLSDGPSDDRWMRWPDLLAALRISNWLERNPKGTCFVHCSLRRARRSGPLSTVLSVGKGITVVVANEDLAPSVWHQSGDRRLLIAPKAPPSPSSITHDEGYWRNRASDMGPPKFVRGPTARGTIADHDVPYVRRALDPLRRMSEAVRRRTEPLVVRNEVPKAIGSADVVVVGEYHNRGYSSTAAAVTVGLARRRGRDSALLLEGVPFDAQRLLNSGEDALPLEVLLRGVWPHPVRQLADACRRARRSGADLLAGGDPVLVFTLSDAPDLLRRPLDRSPVDDARDSIWFTWKHVLMYHRLSAWHETHDGLVAVLCGHAHVFAENGVVERCKRAGMEVVVLLTDVPDLERALEQKLSTAVRAAGWIRIESGVWRPPPEWVFPK